MFMIRHGLALTLTLSVVVHATPSSANPGQSRTTTALTQAADRAEREAGDIANTALDSLRPERVVIVVAMDAEAQPLIGALRLRERLKVFNPGDPMRAFEGQVGKIKVALVVNGKSFRQPRLDLVGPEAAAVTTVAAIKAYRPDLIISAGTAGGMAIDAKVGAVFLSQRILYHDRKIRLGPDWEKYASGDHAHMSVDQAARDLGVKSGTVVTGSSLVNVATDDISSIRNEKAAIVEMEAAAIAERAADYGVRMIALKAVTDLVEHPDPAQFPRNLQIASEVLTRKVVETLTYLQRPKQLQSRRRDP